MQKRLICWILTLCMVIALCPLPAQAAESNELTIYTYLRRELGCNEAVACGILANMYYESGFNPEAYNSGGGYYGLCQWGDSRKERLFDYCAGLGLSAGSLEGQLRYIQYELQTNESSAWEKMKAIENTDKGAYDAGWQWAQYYERCASSHYYERAYRAQNTYWPKYHGTPVPTTPPTSAPTPPPPTPPPPTPTPTPTPTSAPTVGGFTDVKATDYFAEPVVWAVNSGIANGRTSTTFAPKDNCTRAEMVTFLWRAMGQPEPTGENPFNDLTKDWYKKAVLGAAETGITTGTAAGKFSPNETVTRGQTVTFLYRLAGEPQVGADNPFTDIAAGKYFTKGVLWAVQNGVTTGATATLFKPADPCTRGQIVTFLYRDMN